MPVDLSGVQAALDNWNSTAPREAQRAPSNLGSEWTAARHGYASGLAHFGAALTGDEGLRDIARERQEMADQALENSTWTKKFSDVDWTSPSSVGSYVGHLGVTSAPYLMEAIATGGLGSFAGKQIARRGIQAALEAGGEEAAKAATRRAVARGGTGGVVLGSYPSSAGQIFSAQDEQAGEYNKPAGFAMAAPYAALNAVGLEGALARRSFGGALGAKTLAGRVAGGAARMGLSEGASELGQAVLEEGGRKSVDPTYDMTGPEARENYLESFAGGAILGGIPGGMHGGFKGRRQAIPTPDPKPQPIGAEKPTDLLNPEKNAPPAAPGTAADLYAPTDEAASTRAWLGRQELTDDRTRRWLGSQLSSEELSQLPGGGHEAPAGVRVPYTPGPNAAVAEWGAHEVPPVGFDPYAGMRGESGDLGRAPTPAVTPTGFGRVADPYAGMRGIPTLETPAGSQMLLGGGWERPQAAQEAPAPAAREEAPAGQGELLSPTSTVASDFSLRGLRQRILAATGQFREGSVSRRGQEPEPVNGLMQLRGTTRQGAWPDAGKKANPTFEFTLALRVSRLLAEGKVEQAAQYLRTEDEKLQTNTKVTSEDIEANRGVIRALQGAVEDYALREEDARTQELDAATTPGGPAGMGPNEATRRATNKAAAQGQARAQPGARVDTGPAASTGAEEDTRAANADPRMKARMLDAQRAVAFGTMDAESMPRMFDVEPKPAPAQEEQRPAEPASQAAQITQSASPEEAVAHEAAQRAAKERGEILQRVLDDPETRNPVSRFRAELGREGFKTTSLTEAEAAAIERFEARREALSQQTEPVAPNTEGQAPSDNLSGLVKEAKPKQAAPASRPVLSGPTPKKISNRDRYLLRRTPEDIGLPVEAKRRVEPGEAPPRQEADTSTIPDQRQTSMFAGKGRGFTPSAVGEAPRQIGQRAAAMAAQIKGKVASEIFAIGRRAVEAGSETIQWLSGLRDKLKAGKLEAARKQVEGYRQAEQAAAEARRAPIATRQDIARNRAPQVEGAASPPSPIATTREAVQRRQPPVEAGPAEKPVQAKPAEAPKPKPAPIPVAITPKPAKAMTPAQVQKARAPAVQRAQNVAAAKAEVAKKPAAPVAQPRTTAQAQSAQERGAALVDARNDAIARGDTKAQERIEEEIGKLAQKPAAEAAPNTETLQYWLREAADEGRQEAVESRHIVSPEKMWASINRFSALRRQARYEIKAAQESGVDISEERLNYYNRELSAVEDERKAARAAAPVAAPTKPATPIEQAAELRRAGDLTMDQYRALRDMNTAKEKEGLYSEGDIRDQLNQYLAENARRKTEKDVEAINKAAEGDTETRLERSAPVGRRSVIRAGAGFLVAAFGRKAMAITYDARDAALKNDLTGALDAIAARSSNPVYRQLARKLAPLVGNVKLQTIEVGKRYSGGVPAALNGAFGITERSRETGEVSIFLRHDAADPEWSGTNDRTILHEAIHAALMQRIKSLADRGITYNLGSSANRRPGDAAIAKLMDLRGAINKYIQSETALTQQKKDTVWLSEALSDMDEFVAYAMTHDKFQDWMRHHNDGLGKFWGRFVDSVKSFLGFGGKGPNTFLDEVLDAGFNLLDEARNLEPMKPLQTATRNEVATRMERFDPSSPEVPGAVAKAAANFKAEAAHLGRKVAVAAQFLHNIVEEYGGALPALKTWYDSMAKAAARVNQRSMLADNRIRELDKLGEKQSRAVQDLWLDSTWNQVRGDLPRDHALNRKATPEQHAAMEARYNALSPDARRVYSSVLDDFVQLADDTKAALKKLVEGSEENEATKQSAVREIENHFSQLPVYFPLMRFGDHLVVASSNEYKAASDRAVELAQQVDALKNAEGTAPAELKAAREALAKAREDMRSIATKGGYSVQAFETEAEAKAAYARLRDEGKDARPVLRRDFERELDAVPARFMNTLSNILEQEVSRGGERAAAATEMKSLISQAYIATMPDHSALKRYAKREGVAGYSGDARRAYAAAMKRAAHHLARLEQGVDQRMTLEQMVKEAKAADDKAADAAYKAGKTIPGKTHQEVAQEVLRRHAANLRYVDTPIQNAVSNASYLWFLGMTPSFVLTNLAQTPMVTLPMLAARHGLGKAMRALNAAAVDAAKLQADAWRKQGAMGEITPDMLANNGERAMMQVLLDRGRIDLTQEHDLGAIAAGDNLKYRKAMRAASYFPHYTEKFNRVTSALAAYRLAKAEPGMTQERATERAERVVLDSHFDYSDWGAPRFLRTSEFRPAKVMFQFRKYQLAMAHALVHNAAGMFRGDKEARSTFFGLTLASALAAGTLGLPGASALMFIANRINDLFGDPDDPWDAQAAWRNFLLGVMGNFTDDKETALAAEEVLSKGVLRMPGLRDVLPADISGRVGLQDIFNPVRTRQTNNTGRDAWNEIVAATMGPAGTIGGDWFEGAKLAGMGETNKAIEMFLPKMLRDMLRTHRFATEGITTQKGNSVLPADGISPQDLLTQALGFTPSGISEFYAGRSAVEGAKQDLAARRTRLLRDYSEAALANDTDSVREARDAIDHYNQVRREHQDGPAIRFQDMARAAQERRLYQRQLVGGSRLRPRERGLAQYGAFANTGAP